MRVSLENFLDDIADIAVSHVGFTERLLVDLRQVANGVADHGVTQVQLSLIAVGERPGRKVHRREREGLVIERGEVLAEQARLFQLAGGGTDRLAGASQCFPGDSLWKPPPCPPPQAGEGDSLTSLAVSGRGTGRRSFRRRCSGRRSA